MRTRSFPRSARGWIGLLVGFLLFNSVVAFSATDPSFEARGSGPLYPERADGRTSTQPSLEAHDLAGARIYLDGVLDEEAWGLAQTGWGFQENDPERFAEASVPTTFKIVYDEHAIYFGVACWEDDMQKVSSFLSRRDEIQASDFVSIYIDPYHDRTTGYNFRITPDGVLEDQYLFDNGRRDRDWNAVWDAEVSRDERGWYLEARIPFSAIRFKPEKNMTWGLQVYRWLHGRGQDTGWATWERNLSGFVSRWGTLTGLRDVSNPRKLEVLPYILTRHHDPAAEGEADKWENTQTFGADFKYGITANLTLNATFQPDFGQVEADPALLNLSPFETFFQEKRPFFIEGARFFQHPDFNLFYSRRIGTGSPHSRIRGAAKLTGKIGGDISVAVLAAATDLAEPGQAHNPLRVGSERAYYGLVRVGKEFEDGNHRFNVMGTVVKRDASSFALSSPRLQRDAVTGGVDFEMNFADRMYRITGSAVGTAVRPFHDQFDPSLDSETRYGTGGELELKKAGGVWRGELNGLWESDQLDPNDMGFLAAPDEMEVEGEVSYHYDSDGSESVFQNFFAEVNVDKSWLYAGNEGFDLNTGESAWSYGRAHPQFSAIRFFTSAQMKSFHRGWIFYRHTSEGTDKYVTRGYQGQRGPLMTRPGWDMIITGFTTDWRKTFSVEPELTLEWGNNIQGRHGAFSVRWNQSEHFSHSIRFGYSHVDRTEQWIFNTANDGSMPDVDGIGGVDYVFGGLDQKTWDITLRSSLLFDRNKSLQLYLQPFLTRGNYSQAKWLATPDSYDLQPYDIKVSNFDFNFGAMNLNLVFRWEYRSGSTVYLVWTHSKEHYEERGFASSPGSWRNAFDAGFPFRSEPGNTLLAKLSYWFNL